MCKFGNLEDKHSYDVYVFVHLYKMVLVRQLACDWNIARAQYLLVINITHI